MHTDRVISGEIVEWFDIGGRLLGLLEAFWSVEVLFLQRGVESPCYHC
jgi:hypothetical protein